MLRRVLKTLLLLAILAGLVELYRSDSALFIYPQDKLARANVRLRRALAKQSDLALLYSADQPPGRDWVSDQPVEIAGVTTHRGQYGTALRFDGGRRNFVNLPLRWQDLGPSFSIALWLRLDDASPDQEIVFSRKPEPLGLKLDRGQMSFFLSTNRHWQVASYAFTNYHRFVQVAAVVDGQAGVTRLYEDGVQRAEIPSAAFVPPLSRMAIGKGDGQVISEPLMGDVDEVLIWKRALSGGEVADLAGRGKPALDWMAPRARRSYGFALALRSGIQRTLKLVDMFNPAMHPGRVERESWPEVNLVLSKKDAQYFARAHRRALRDGRQSEASAERRTIDVLEHGRGFRGHLSLAGSDSIYPTSPRKPFILEPTSGETVLGLPRLRLLPPESAGWIGPLVETRVARELGIPTLSNGWCQLVINGERQGLYYFEDYQTLGVPTGFGARRFEGVPTRTSWLRVCLAEPPPLTRDDLVRIRDEVMRESRGALVSDAQSPFSGREIQYRLREEKKRIEKWPLDEKNAQRHPVAGWADRLTEFFILGSNRAPEFLVYNLNLQLKLPPGLQVTWRSQDPSVLTDDGTLAPPLAGKPRPVVLTAIFSDGVTNRSVDLNFRVMPIRRTLPTFFLWADTLPQRLARVDCAVEYLPEGTGVQPRRWLAGQENRSGLSWRGHTSLDQPKKPFGLRLPEPHGFWGTTNVFKVNLVNPFRDPTFLRNRLSYEMFSRMAGPGQRRDGLPVGWAEVFVNGKYFGLFEASVPVRAEWLGLPPFEKDQAYPTVMYKAQLRPPSTAKENRWMMRQTEPSRRHGVFSEPLFDLHRFLEYSTPEEFVRGVDQWLDVDNLLDFHLLLSATENYNGWPFNYPVHDILVRPAGEGQRFFLVPFDFDTTWDPHPVGFYYSQVFIRLKTLYPGYSERLARRWFELRRGPLDLAVLEADIQRYAAQLDGYVERDDRRWFRYEDQPYAQRVDQLRTIIRGRFAQLDAEYAALLSAQNQGGVTINASRR